MLLKKTERFMIAGLGNPGRQYEKTRHNAGFMALDRLEEAFQAGPVKTKKNAQFCKAEADGRELILVRPLTFMNLSGGAVNEIGSFFKIPQDHIIVIADDVSLDVGRLRIRRKGSAGGHNGLKDIIRVLGSDAFLRIKIGVGQKPRADYDLADWVLGRFPGEDLPLLEEALQKIPGAVRLLVRGEFAEAQNQYNR